MQFVKRKLITQSDAEIKYSFQKPSIFMFQKVITIKKKIKKVAISIFSYKLWIRGGIFRQFNFSSVPI